MLYSYFDDFNEKHLVYLYEEWEVKFLKERFGNITKE
jgi:hypothetical protein